MYQNMYQAPEAQLIQNHEETELVLASTAQRLLNLVIDYIGFLAFSMLVGIICGLTGTGDLIHGTNKHLLGLILMSLYLIPQEAIFGRTIGKLITKTKVVDMEGNKIGLGKAIIRTLSRAIPFEAFTFLGGRGRPRGLHDKLSKTKVIALKG